MIRKSGYRIYLLMLFLLPGILAPGIRAQADTLDLEFYEAALGSMQLELSSPRENFHVLIPLGIAGNIAILEGEEKLLLVDDQYAALIPRIKDMLAGVTDKEIGMVINTHFHYDHVDGNRVLGPEGIPILAHRQVLSAMSGYTELTPPANMVQAPYPEEALPTSTMEDSLSMEFGGERIFIKHFCAHTGGDLLVHFKEADIWHTGDIFVSYGLPYIDEWNGGDIYGMIDAMNYMLDRSGPGTIVIPGHGPVCSPSEARAYRDMLVSLREQVKDMLQEGLSLEDMGNKIKIPDGVPAMNKEAFISHMTNMIQRHEN